MQEPGRPGPQTRRPWWLTIPAAVLCGCAVVWVAVQAIAYVAGRAGIAIPPLPGLSDIDCRWSGLAVAWIDGNANGVYDKGELPFPGVAFHVDDALRGIKEAGETACVSDWKGEAGLVVWLPSCSAVRLEVYADVPDGFRPTTAPRLIAGVREHGRTLRFGFAYLPGVPTATPRPPGPVCTSYKIGQRNRRLMDLVAGPDGTVWAATFRGGVARYDPAEDRWVSYRASDGLIDDGVNAITLAGDGSVWFATEAGVSRFDGSRWVSYPAGEDLTGRPVYRVAVDSDGTVWLATFGGVAHFDPRTETWASKARVDGPPCEGATGVAVSPDGSVWVPTLTHGLVRLVRRPQGLTWTVYHKTGTSDPPLDLVGDIAIAPDGACWFASQDGITRHDPATETWTVYDQHTSNGAFMGRPNALAIAPDGSVWIATSTRGPAVYHFIPSRGPTAPDAWQLYDARDGLPKAENDAAMHIAVVSDCVVWVGTSEVATRCDFCGGARASAY